MKFIWDENKEKINIAKHGIDFDTATLVFGDANRLEKYDVKHSLIEDRYITIGMVKTIMLVVMVVYTERSDKVRIISARPASKIELEEYYDCRKRH